MYLKIEYLVFQALPRVSFSLSNSTILAATGAWLPLITPGISPLAIARLYGIFVKFPLFLPQMGASLHMVIGLLSEFPLLMIIAICTAPFSFIHFLLTALRGAAPGFDDLSSVLNVYLMSALIHSIRCSLKNIGF